MGRRCGVVGFEETALRGISERAANTKIPQCPDMKKYQDECLKTDATSILDHLVFMINKRFKRSNRVMMQIVLGADSTAVVLPKSRLGLSGKSYYISFPGNFSEMKLRFIITARW